MRGYTVCNTNNCTLINFLKLLNYVPLFYLLLEIKTDKTVETLLVNIEI